MDESKVKAFLKQAQNRVNQKPNSVGQCQPVNKYEITHDDIDNAEQSIDREKIRTQIINATGESP